MKGNFSRLTRVHARPEFSSVLLQQGRVLLDSDWNDLVEILERELRRRTRMIIGPAGGPEHAEGFGIGFLCGLDLNSGGPRDGQYDQEVTLRRRPSLPFRETSADLPYTLRIDFLLPKSGCCGDAPRAVLLGVPGRFTILIEKDLCLVLYGPDDRPLARLGRVEAEKLQTLCVAYDGQERLDVWSYAPPAADKAHRDEVDCPAWAGPNLSPTRDAVTIGGSSRGDGFLRFTFAGLWIWDARMEPGSEPKAPLEPAIGCQTVCALDLSAVEPRPDSMDAVIPDASGKGNHGMIRRRQSDQRLPPVRLLGAWIGAGHYVVDGLDAHNPRPVPFDHQPWTSAVLPGVTDRTERAYLFYLQVWERFVSALQYPQIVEPALGGPDTTARTQTIWQVQALESADAAEAERRFTAMKARRDATGTARFYRPADQVGQAGNRLYRAEIHHPGFARTDVLGPEGSSPITVLRASSRTIAVHDSDIADLLQVGSPVLLSTGLLGSSPLTTYVACVLGDQRFDLGDLPATLPPELRLRPLATFKWSNENGDVAFPVREVAPGSTAPSNVWVFSLENAGYNGFDLAPDDYLELIDDAQDLARRGGTFFKLTVVDPNQLVLTTESAKPLDSVSLGQRPVLRRWRVTEGYEPDPTTDLPPPLRIVGGSSPLDQNIYVELGADGFYAGAAWWVVPVRDEVGDGLLWPGERMLPPQGIVLHEARLATLELGLGHAKVRDLRSAFAPLTELTKDQRSPNGGDAKDVTALVETLLQKVWGGRACVLVEGNGHDLPGLERTGVRVEGRSLPGEPWVPVESADAPRGPGVALIWQHRPVFLGDAASRLDERGAWQPIAAFDKRVDFAAVAVGSRLWLFGGRDPTTRDNRTYSIIKYLDSPSATSWTELTAVTYDAAAVGLGAVALAGRIHLLGGVTANGTTKSHQVFDPKTYAFTAAADMLTARKNFAVVAHEGLLYVLGGCDSSDAYLSTVDCYDPITDSWQSVPPLDEGTGLGPTTDLAAASTPEGIVVAGGFGGTAESEAWLFRPELRRWQSLSPLSVARSRLGLVLTSSFREPDRPAVYVIGGVDDRRAVSQIEALHLTRTYEVMRTAKGGAPSP